MTLKISWLRGCATALITPFHKDGSIDEDCYKKLVERQVMNGIKLLVPCGTTGESVTMTDDEKLQIIRLTVEVAHKQGAKVIAGTGSNNTAATIELTRKAREAGADAALLVAPYYNKPTQEGLFHHFSEIARSVKDFPIMLYNVPSRTASNITGETTQRLAAACENIVATKEASGDLSQTMNIIKSRSEDFKVFAGDDAAALALIAVGADGLVSVCSNELPAEMARFIEKALDGAHSSARRTHYQLLPIMEANFIESSPAPCKFVMSEMGLLENNLRLPLVPITKQTEEKLRKVMESFGG